MAKILHVEDDKELAESVANWFSTEGHVCESVNNGTDALQLLRHFKYDIILLDWSLPDIPGPDVCMQFRKEGGKSWIIFLTGKEDVSDKEQALDMGGDDFVTKPFEIRELSARVRSALRRPTETFQLSLKIEDVTLDVSRRIMLVHDVEHRLMPREVALLEYLMRHPNVAFSTKKLMAAVWPSDGDATEGAVRTAMHALRKSLESAGKPEFISTILGEGYTIKVGAD